MLFANNALAAQQYGFLPKRSVAACQLDFFDHITTAIDAGNAIILIFLDIQKAFDQVPHKQLLHKLYSTGVRGSLLRWFESYLTDRTQVTMIGSHLSDPLEITSGVIQGSVLGPTLFLLYINDILRHVRHGQPFLFADDIKIAYTFRQESAGHALINIQSDLDALTHWSALSGLSF